MGWDGKNRGRGGRSGGRRGGGRGGGGGGGGWKERRPPPAPTNTDCPVQNMFGHISRELDMRHDKRERIVKISRDITIESKRIIFALHRIKTDEDKASVLAEAARRFTELRSGLWLQLATELLGEEGEQFLRAYSAGLQEWVEALSFYHFLATGTVVNYDQVKGELEWKVGKWSSSPVRPGIAHWEMREKVKSEENEMDKSEREEGRGSEKEGEEEKVPENDVGKTEKAIGAVTISQSEADEESLAPQEVKRTEMEEAAVAEKKEWLKEEDESELLQVSIALPQSEFIMGLADLTGELMRNAINSLATGNTEVCFSLLALLQTFAEAFDKLERKEAPRDLGGKVRVLKQSMRKVEQACYSIQVRGSEIPKNHLVDIFTDFREDKEASGRGREEDEESFYD